MGNSRLTPLIVLGSLLTGCAPPGPPVGATLPVAVDVRCTGQDVTFAVSPWYLELSAGDEIVWNLADAAQSIEIRKSQSAWPFQNNKFTGTSNDPPASRAMKGGQQGKRFRYSVAVTCQVAGESRRIVLDPDLYIKR